MEGDRGMGGAATTDQLDAAERALRFVFPGLVFLRPQITPQAASFAAMALRACNARAHGSYAAFSAYDGALGSTLCGSWARFPPEIVRGVLDVLPDGAAPAKNALAASVLEFYYQRQLQQHLGNPTFAPCPEFRIGNTLLDRLVFGD